MVSVETLGKHIERTLEQGASQKEVTNRLVRAGWPEDVVQHYIAEAPAQKLAFLKMEGITKSFDGRLLLDRVDLVIPSGGILGIVGVSGAGKSTLLHILVGFVEPDAGDVILTLQGEQPISIMKHPESLKSLIGFSTQIPSFYGKLTITENLQHFAALYGLRGLELTERCTTIMNFVGINDFKDTLAQNLSGGLQKRLDIACSLLHNPKILILDEPTADLDQLAAEYIWRLIKHVNEKGTTVIIASHLLDDLERMCTSIAVLRDKRIMEVGTPDNLKNIYSRQYTVTIETTHKTYPKLLSLIKANKIKIITAAIKQDSLFITTLNPDTLITKLPAFVNKCGDTVILLHVSKPSFRDVFQTLIRKPANEPLKK